jgi:glycosyltransferase involved in cell wall biosynthesis
MSDAGSSAPVVVFAHVPPPHHGQSQMVKLLVDGLRARPGLGVEVLHVDARLSEDMGDVGAARSGKVGLLMGHCREALRLGRARNCRTLYYVPSPPKRTSLYRDFLALARLRRWFSEVVFHWHAVGLGEWLDGEANVFERWLARRLLGGVSLSLVLAETNRADATRLNPRRIEVVSNGIPDPCPDFESVLGARVGAVVDTRRVLFLAHCTREKGLFEALDAVVLANARAKASGRRRRFRLTVAGSFLEAGEEREFRERAAAAGPAVVEIAGFVKGPAKDRLLRESDVFLFPTYFANEGQPLNVIEAMAHGLPVVTTRWRSLPEYFREGYPGLVNVRDVAALAEALERVAELDGRELRAGFMGRFELEPHLEAMARALRSVSARREPV